MTNLLYVGNNLQNKSSNSTSIQILGKLLENEGYTVYYASGQNNKLIRLIDMLVSVIRYANKVDAVLIDTYSTQNFYYAFLVSQICRLLRLPYVPILRGGNLPMRLRKYPKLSKLIFKPAYRLISPSFYLKELFKKEGFLNVECIPNVIEIKNYLFGVRDFTNVKLLWVRSFSEIYNPKLAVRILKELQDNGINASLCMVGPDSDGSLKEVKQLVSDLNVSVRFTGKLTKAKWRILANDYNIFINTTNFDNMPVSVIEGMALGLPIISTDVGGMSYLIQDGIDGLLVPPNDVNAFTNAIIKVVNNPEISKAMALKARQKVEYFDWEVVKHQWFEVLK